jgi:hypothetical protein
MFSVTKSIYSKSTGPGMAQMVGVAYAGPGLDRIEIHCQECAGRDDMPIDPMRRWSHDNGRTWSEFEALPQIVEFRDGNVMQWYPPMPFWDPIANISLGVWLRQACINTPERSFYYNQCYVRTSDDLGRIWSEPDQLRYEPGTYFDENDPFDPAFIENNQIYMGNNIIRHSNGTLVHAGVCIRIPSDAPDPDPERKFGSWDIPSESRNIGSMCFIGTWNPEQRKYTWTHGDCVWVTRSVSCRGLMEPELAELKDGRLLVIWRGSDTELTEGRKWFSISNDGGKTLSPVTELKYEDGSRFYSPSSIHRTIRHSVTGKLYWIGNIVPDTPKGNMPRHPLIIAEINEEIPAIIKDSVFVIDYKQESDSDDLQLSNFSVFENRETHDIELYLTRYGSLCSIAEDPIKYYESDSYRYILHLESDHA